MAGAKKKVEQLLQDLSISASPIQAPRPSSSRSAGYDDEVKSSEVFSEDGDDGFSAFSFALSSESFATISSQEMLSSLEVPKPQVSGSRMSEIVESEVRKRTATLEEKIAGLNNKRVQLEKEHTKELERREKELVKTQQDAASQLAELQKRQAAVEAEAPILATAIQDAKAQLHDLRISDEKYLELSQIAPSKRSLREEVMLKVHELTRTHQQEEEVLRRERDTSREAAAAAVEESERLRREVTRTQAALSASDKDVQKEVQAAHARSDRLEQELEDALLKVEVLGAKGAMFDEVQAKVDKLQGELAEAQDQARGNDTELRVLRQERGLHENKMRDKEHAVQLLTMDKGYLSKEAASLGEQVRRGEAERDRLEAKVKDLKRERQTLQDRVMAQTDDSRLAAEQRLQAEVARMRSEHLADVDKVRAECSALADAELRVLRERRDVAEREALNQGHQLKELQALYDDLLVNHRELQRTSDLRQAELYSEVKMRQFEAERLGVVAEEQSQTVKQAKLEAEMLQKKLKVATDSYYTMETVTARKQAELEAMVASQAARLSHYEMLEADIDSAVLHAAALPPSPSAGGSPPSPGDIVASAGTGVPTAVQRRVQQSLHLARRCSELQKQVERCVAEKSEADAQMAALQRHLDHATAKLDHAAQPYNYLVDVLHTSEQNLKGSEERAAALEGELGEAQAALQEARAALQQRERDMEALREDLGAVLSERSALADMRSTLHMLNQTHPSSPAAAGTARKPAAGARGHVPEGAENASGAGRLRGRHGVAGMGRGGNTSLVFGGEGD